MPSQILEQQLAAMGPSYARLLDEAVRSLKQLDSVEVVAAAGSVADGIADKYSDLDLQCGVRGDIDSVSIAVRDSVFALVEVGDHRWTVPNRILSIVTTDWLRVDVILVRLDDPQDRFAHNALELVNTSGMPLARRSPPTLQPDPAALTEQVTRFLRSLGLVVRDLHRGDLRLCCLAVEFLVNELVTLMYQAEGLKRGAQKGSYSHLPAQDVHVLQALPVAQPEERSIIDGHIAVADEYLRRARLLSERWGAVWPSEMVEGTRLFMRAELGAELAPI